MVGGYTPLPWKTGDYEKEIDKSNQTFLFSLTMKKKFGIRDCQYAVCYNTSDGPMFGGGNDFAVINNANETLSDSFYVGNSFEYSGNKEDFYGVYDSYRIEEFEFYQVIF